MRFLAGYIDGNLFFDWFTDIFIPNCNRRRPALLIMDNHESHLTYKLLKKAKEENVRFIYMIYWEHL